MLPQTVPSRKAQAIVRTCQCEHPATSSSIYKRYSIQQDRSRSPLRAEDVVVELQCCSFSVCQMQQYASRWRLRDVLDMLSIQMKHFLKTACPKKRRLTMQRRDLEEYMLFEVRLSEPSRACRLTFHPALPWTTERSKHRSSNMNATMRAQVLGRTCTYAVVLPCSICFSV